MKTSLSYKVYRTLRRGLKRLTPDAQKALQAFVVSQQTPHGYMNAGGCEDPYYGQFGEVLQAVFHPIRLLHSKIHLTVPESRHQDTIYGLFFDFLEHESGVWSREYKAMSHSLGRDRREQELKALSSNLGAESSWTTNAICCVLSIQHQMGIKPDSSCVEWLQQQQDETGGFHASEQAPIPDLLSTAVAMFTLRLMDASTRDASQFVQAHWLNDGGFAPTLLDDYSDVEYVFYGLLALGSL